MKNVANWIAEHPYVAGGALIGFVILVWAVGFDNATALLSQITGE